MQDGLQHARDPDPPPVRRDERGPLVDRPMGRRLGNTASGGYVEGQLCFGRGQGDHVDVMAVHPIRVDPGDLVQLDVGQHRFAKEVVQDLARAAQADRLGDQPRRVGLHHRIIGLTDALEHRAGAQLLLDRALGVLVDEFPAQLPSAAQPGADGVQGDDVDAAAGEDGRVLAAVQDRAQRLGIDLQPGGGGVRALWRASRDDAHCCDTACLGSRADRAHDCLSP